jgi:uncharacterized delta-60 repeat protein
MEGLVTRSWSCNVVGMQALSRIGPLGVASGLALVIALTALAAPGDLDPTFGANGRVVLSPAIEAYADAAAVQPDGKIVLAGLVDDQEPPPPPPPAPYALRASNADFLAVRLNADGSLDPSFAGGSVRTPIDLANNGYDRAWAVAVGPGGTVVLGGDAAAPAGTRDFAFVRHTSAGALDTSFSGNGIQTVNVGSFDSIADLAVQPDGKVVAVGRAGAGFTVVRLLADGALDPTFGSGGIVDTPIGNPSLADEASAVALLADGRILVAGTADYDYPYPTDFALVRYLPTGQLDQSFGLSGVVVTETPGEQIARALAPTPSGGIVVAGYGDRAFRLARYRPNGALDSTFGTGGIVSTSIGTLYSDPRAVLVQADGKVIAGGTTRDAFPSMWDELAAARYDVDGTLDTSFGNGGTRRFDALAGHDDGRALVVQPGAGSGRSTDRLIQVGRGSDGDGEADHVLAIGIELGPLAPPPPPIVRCRVPRVVHLRLAKARSKIRRALCSVGRIRRVRARRFRGIVVRQSPRAGRQLRRGGPVHLVVGRR